ncbi:hypothetical protein Ddc_17242 [Ditylenchus destructor]|nr:hypothetical protein Ddc_17242 [Ditylenchus destructor]
MRRWSLGPATIKIFSNDFSAEEYNDWIIRNNYSKQIPVEVQKQIPLEEERITAYFDETYHYLKVYELTADDYKDPSQDTTSAFSAHKKVNNETWPLFQHFVRLLTDPFIHIRRVELVPQNDVFNLLASTIDRSNRGRLQCENLRFAVQSNYPKLLNWIKDHVRCVSFRIDVSSPNCFTQLLDFSATGSDCTSEMSVYMYISKAFIIDLVQKFMNLKNCDESHFVHSIRGFVTKRTTEALNSEYGEFLIKEDSKRNGLVWRSTLVFEFINVDIETKIQLAVIDYIDLIYIDFIPQIINL